MTCNVIVKSLTKSGQEFVICISIYNLISVSVHMCVLILLKFFNTNTWTSTPKCIHGWN